MNFNLKNSILFALVFSVFIMTGCSSVQDNSAYLLEYENQYRKQYPYAVHNILRDGNIIHAREFGKHNPGAAILLMHGFPDSLHLYDRLVPLLAEKRRVIAFDFIGWGDSAKPEDHAYNAESLLKDLDAVINYFEFSQVVLVAHDISGFPAIDWALDNSSNVDTVVLLNSVYNPMQSIVLPEAIELFSTPGMISSIRRWGSYQSDATWQQGLMGQISHFFSNAYARDTYVKIFGHQALQIRPAFFELNKVLSEELENRQEEVPRMKEFTKPVSIIFGGDDPYLNTAVAKEFDAIFPNSSLNIILGAGHYVQLDNPDEVARLILKSMIHR